MHSAYQDSSGASVGLLDLIEVHLPTPEYQRLTEKSVLRPQWYVPQGVQRLSDMADSYYRRVQSFAHGGFELFVGFVDCVSLSEAMRPAPVQVVPIAWHDSVERPALAALMAEADAFRRVPRVRPSVQSVESIDASRKRSASRMRVMVSNMLADHMVTLTVRENRGPSGFMLLGHWKQAWAVLLRCLSRIAAAKGEVFHFVAVPELHESGAIHLHVAWRGFVNVEQVRKLWRAALDRFGRQGNCDAKYFKRTTRSGRVLAIGRYLAKYIKKGLADAVVGFNAKRYWGSKQGLEPARRYILGVDNLADAVQRTCVEMDLDLELFRVNGVWENLVWLPDGAGLWLRYVPELHGKGPPF